MCNRARKYLAFSIYGRRIWSVSYTHLDVYKRQGLVAVNDKAASNDVLKAAYKAASGKKTFVWTLDAFEKKSQKVLDLSLIHI